MAVSQQAKQLPHHSGCCAFLKIALFLQCIGQRCSVLVLHDHKKPMIILEELIDLGYCRMINFLEFADLQLEELSFMTSYLILIDDVDCADQSCLDMDDLSQLIELILLQAGRQDLILRFNAALNLSDEVFLLKLHLRLAMDDFHCGLIRIIGGDLIAHFEQGWALKERIQNTLQFRFPKMKTIPFYLVLALLLLATVVEASGCTVCSKCTGCGAEVMADGYLDDIDALMQAKVQSLGYPLTIARNATPAAITYTIQYSSGLLIVLQLSLTNMQIQLLSYSINSAAAVPATPVAPATPVTTYKTTADGYYILENFNSSKQVSEIMIYLESVIKISLTNFQLVGVQFSNASALLYRLSFKVLPISSGLISVIETVLVQYISTNNCLLIDSNYTGLSSNLSWNALDNKAILSDPFIAAINTLLLNKYGNLLGKSPTIVSLALALPYYQVVYQVDSTSYSFIILYDYFQNRILQGNLTTSKSVTTYTQASPTITQSSSGSAQAASSGSTQSGTSTSQTTSATSSSSIGSVNAPTVTVSPSVVSSQSSATTSSTSSSSSSGTVTAATTSSNSGSTSTSSASTSASSTASQSSSPSTSQTTTSSSVYQQIAHFQSSAEVKSAVNYLASIGQSFSMSQVQSVQKMTNGSNTLYQITIQLSNLGSVAISNTIFYQYVLLISTTGSYSIQQAAYSGLNTPNFVALSIDEVKKDENIKVIARYLLSQQFPMLSSSSQVLAVFRDIPYYQIVFQGTANNQLTFVILYGFNGAVQIMSATSKQTATSQQTSTQTATKTSSNGQASSATTQSGQSSQASSSQAAQVIAQTQVTQTSQSQGQTNSNTNIPQTTSTQATQNSPVVTQTTQSTQTNQNSQSIQIPQSNQGTQSAQTTQATQTVQSQTSQTQQTTQGSQTAQVNPTLPSIQPVLQQTTQGQSQSSTQQSSNSNSGQSQTVASASQSAEPVFVQIKQTTNNANNTQSTTKTSVQQAQTQGTSSVTSSTNTPQNASSGTGASPSSTTVTTTTSTSTATTASSLPVSTTTSSSVSSSQVKGSSQTSQSTAQTPATTSQTSTTAANPSAAASSVSGFNHFGSATDQFYSYVIQGANQINQTLVAKGYNLSQINYKDIVYKLEGNVLTILFKIQAGGYFFTYQYRGSLGSSYQLTSTAQPSAIQTSSDTQSFASDSKTIVSGGVTYQLAPSSVINEAYVQNYLDFLSSSDICYSRSNLVGIYINPSSPRTIFFRFKNSTQYYNIVTSTVEIQRILNIYLSDSNQQSSGSSQTAATTTSTTTGSQTASQSQTSQGSSASTSISTQAATASTNNQAGLQSQTLQSTQTAQDTQTGQATQIAQSTQNAQTIQSTQISQTNQNVQNTQTNQASSSQSSTIFQNVQANQASQGSQSSQQASQTTQASQIVQTAPIKSSQVITIAKVDPHCLCYNQDKCLKCAHRYYLNNNQCIQVPNECLSYDINTGACVKCLPGYSLLNGVCKLDDVTAYYYEGQCFQCLGDYRLVNRKCIYAPVTDQKSEQYLQTKNPLCLSWNNGVCDECLPGTYLSSRKVCELVDPFCSLFDYAKEVCNTCNEGYALRNGRCFIL